MKNKLILIGLVFLSGMILSFTLYHIIQKWQKNAEYKSYEHLSAEWAASLQREIDQHIEILYSLRAFYHGNQFIDRYEFKTFTEGTIHRHPEIQSIEWIPFIRQNEWKLFEKNYQEDIQQGLEIFTYSQQGQKIKVPLTEESLPVIYLEPFEQNKLAWGRDYAKNSKLLKAMQLARDTGEAIISSQFELQRISDTKKKTANILFLAVYQKTKTPPSIEERRESLRGFVALVLRPNLIIEEVFQKILPFTEIIVFDDEKKDSQNIIYHSLPLREKNKNLLKHDEKIFIANQYWFITFLSNPKSIEGGIHWEAQGSLFTGILVTLFVSFYLVSLVYQNIKIQKEIEKKTEQLQRSNQDLQQFAYVASHDLQEPLRKILAFGERLESKIQDKLNEDEKDYLNRICNASQRMQKLIEDLLKYSRISTQPHLFEKVDLNLILQEVLSDLESRLEQSQGSVEFQKLPTLEADPLQIRQLLQNMISNALKFHKAGQGSHVRIKSEVVDKNLILKIEDDGIGFDEKFKDRIFQPFQRLHGREEYEGTGIGLAICKKIIHRHQGHLNVESKEGKGSTFIIQLPLKQKKDNRHELS